jgi:Tfp pilus assembly protein PilO
MALLPDDPKKKNAVFAAILALVGLYAFNSFWYVDVAAELYQTEARLEQLDDQNRRAQIIATRGGRELEEKLVQYERHLIRLEQLIPRSDEVPALLNSITVQSRQHNVNVTLLRPEVDEQGTDYIKDLYQVGVEGNYHAVGRFMAAIASLPRIITPTDLDMTLMQAARAADLNNNEDGDDFPVTAQFRIMTYLVPNSDGPGPVNPNEAAQTAGGGE